MHSQTTASERNVGRKPWQFWKQEGIYGKPFLEGLTKEFAEADRRMTRELNRLGLGGASSFQLRARAQVQEEYDVQRAAAEKARLAKIIRRRELGMSVQNNPGSSSHRPTLLCTIERGRNTFVFDAGGAPPVHFDMVQFAGCEASYVPRLISAKLLQQWRLNGPWPSANDVSHAIAKATPKGSYQQRDPKGRYAGKAGAIYQSKLEPRAWLHARVMEVATHGK